MTHKYDDIIHLPHPEPKTRPRMPMRDRAAQFAPFAALTGHHAAIAETARWTGERVELDASEVERLNEVLTEIEALHQPQITVTCFRPDARKEGGAYVTLTGAVGKIDPIRGVLRLTDRREIPLGEILEISLDG